MEKLSARKWIIVLFLVVGLLLGLLPWLILFFSSGFSYILFDTQERNLLLTVFLLLSIYSFVLAYTLVNKIWPAKKSHLTVLFLVSILFLLSFEIIVFLFLGDKFTGEAAEILSLLGGGLATLPLLFSPLEIYLLSLWKKKEK